MRVNIYAEELPDNPEDAIELHSKKIDGHEFTGLRIYLYLPVTVGHQGDGEPINRRGPFIHRPGDDDSSAITFWGKQDLRPLLRHALRVLDQHYVRVTRSASTAGDAPGVDGPGKLSEGAGGSDG